MSGDIECPYCEKIFDWNGDPFDEGEEKEECCPFCDKNFIVTASYSVHYSSSKADCLNGAEHNFKEIVGYPREYFENKRRCSMCGKEITLDTIQNSEDKKDGN